MASQTQIWTLSVRPYHTECNKGTVSFSTEEPVDFTGYRICITLINTENEKPDVLHTVLLTADRQATDHKFTVEKITSPIEKSVRKIRNIFQSTHKQEPVVLAKMEKQYICGKDLALAYYVNGKVKNFWVNLKKLDQLEKEGHKDNLQYKIDGLSIENVDVNTYVENDSLHKTSCT